MRVELTIDRTKKLPDGAVPALEAELLSRLSQQYNDCKLTIKRASSDGLSVFGGEKKEVERILQETWESADEWFY
ncbi:TPA: DinI family protein [Citrobacter freundii]|nr:DinI family protein [Citrobacter freundii]HAT3770928.1 DinI family protein [Citrobacter freundii]